MSVPSERPSENAKPVEEGFVSFVSSACDPRAEISPVEPSADFIKDARNKLTKPRPGLNEVRGIPAVYAKAFVDLLARQPDNVPDDRWRHCLDDSRVFFERWGGQAQKLGWTARDLLGLHAVAPMSRYDVMGLLWSLKGERVVEFGAKMAKLSGGLTVRRRSL